MNEVGISGIGLYLPKPKVQLDDFASWHDLSQEKLLGVIGESFRLPSDAENVYTMAANAVLNLLRTVAEFKREHIAYFALATESSLDNAVSSIQVKGMVDHYLKEQNEKPLSPFCEVPEFKHACLAGVYALKAAYNFIKNQNEKNTCAIVVCSDIARYEKGSSGEPTQGAGAVAFLIDSDCLIAKLQMEKTGLYSHYRKFDFRKPIKKHFFDTDFSVEKLTADTPVFEGDYSTAAYLDTTTRALFNLAEKENRSILDLFQEADEIYYHRPYKRMPQNAFCYTLSAIENRDKFEEDSKLLEHYSQTRNPSLLKELKNSSLQKVMKEKRDSEKKTSIKTFSWRRICKTFRKFILCFSFFSMGHGIV